jgi:AcrR family transcriptional regulator
MARSEQQNQRMRDDRRGKILSSAVKLFATRGLAATKVSDVAAAVGMAQGLLYHYFGSKEEIFVEIVRRAFERMNTAALALERMSQPPHVKLAIAVTEILRSIESSDDFAWYSTLLSVASISDAVPPEAKAIISRERAVPYEVITRIVRAGQRAGSVRQGAAEDLALVFWTAVKGLALHKTTLGPAFTPPAASVLASIFFEDAAKPRAAEPRARPERAVAEGAVAARAVKRRAANGRATNRPATNGRTTNRRATNEGAAK